MVYKRSLVAGALLCLGLFVSSFSSCFCAYDQDDPASLYDEAQHDGASPAAALAAKKLADSIQSIRAANPRIFGKSSDSGLPRKSRRPRADVPASDAAYGSGLPRRPRADVPAAPDDVYGSGLPSRSRRPRADGVPAASGAAYDFGLPRRPRADVPAASGKTSGSGLPRRPRADVPAASDDVYGRLPSRSRRPRADGVPAASGAAYGSGFPSEPRAASGGGFDDDVI